MFHAPFSQEKFKQRDLFAKAAEHIVCTRDTIFGVPKASAGRLAGVAGCVRGWSIADTHNYASTSSP